jgi:hypothetical protein
VRVSPPAARVQLEIELGSDPIAGFLTGPRGDACRFTGWIELAEAIEDARVSRIGGCERPAARSRHRVSQGTELGRQLPGGLRRTL